MVDTIIFDIGMVLVDFCWKEHLHSFGFPEEIEEKVGYAVFQSGIWPEYDRGVLSDEEIVQKMIPYAPEYEEQIRQVNHNLAGCIRPFSYGEDWIRKLKEQGKKVYYLSNYGKTLRHVTKTALKAIAYCDGGLFSYEIKKMKPEKEMYLTLLEKYQLKPENCVFIDDVQKNIEGAQAVGIQGIRFTSYEDACHKLESICGENRTDCDKIEQLS